MHQLKKGKHTSGKVLQCINLLKTSDTNTYINNTYIQKTDLKLGTRLIFKKYPIIHTMMSGTVRD